MKTQKETYTPPAITEVKFEDKNLVLFLSCSKQSRVEGSITNGCCDLKGPFGSTPASAFDPS